MKNLFEFGNAICYSGYREGQSPVSNIFPSYEEIKQDILLLAHNWSYLRLYDPNKHAELVLEVISNENLDIKVMLGVCLDAEISNPKCPWGANYSDEQLSQNRINNQQSIESLVHLAKKYSEIVFSLSTGNEATVEWSDHIVPIESIINYVRYIKKNTNIPVTFCENYIPWQGQFDRLADEIDFISLHTYPLWEYKSIDEALRYSKKNLKSVSDRFLDKPIVITEAGWATNSNGRGMNAEYANEFNQVEYLNQLLLWSKEENMLIFIFEAFDEDWKGSNEPLEPEKHWGIYFIDRTPKMFLKNGKN